jgi:hypothetical protein
MLQMTKIFLGLVFWNIVLFGVTIWMGVTHRSAGWEHQGVGVLTGIYTCLVHSIVFIHFIGSGKGIKEAVQVHDLADDPQTGYVRRTRKFKARAFPFAFFSCIFILVAVWLGAAKDVGMLKGLTHAYFSYLALAFNLFAFWREYTVIRENTAMIREIDAKIEGKL